VDELGTPGFGLGNVAKGGGVVLCRVGADCQYAIAIGNVIPVVGHGPAAKCFRQTGDSGGMSYAGVVFQVDHA